MTETKNEEKVEEKNYINFTDSLIEKIFDSNEDMGIGDWGLGPIPNPQSPISNFYINNIFTLNINNSISTNKKILVIKCH